MSQLTDSFGRSFPYLRLSLTEACNFRCSYCLPDGYQADGHPRFLQVEEIGRLVRAFAALGMSKIRLTGGEPSLRKDLDEIIATVAAVPGIRKVAITTNGTLLPRRLPGWHRAGLAALNVSMDSLQRERFKTITGHDRLPEIQQGLALAQALGLPAIKLNAVLLRGLNDDELPRWMDYLRDRPFSVRFIELMRTGDNEAYFQRHHLRARKRNAGADIAQHQPVVIRKPERGIQHQLRQIALKQRDAPGDMARGMVYMQRLPLLQRGVALECDNNPFRRRQRLLRKQPVAARNIRFFRIAANVQRDTLPGVSLVNRLVLRMQPAHAHRLFRAGEPEGFARFNLAGKRGAGHHQTGAVLAESAVSGQPETVRGAAFTLRQLAQMRAQRLNASVMRGGGNKNVGFPPASFAQRCQHLFAHRLNARFIHPVRFGQRYGQRGLSGKLQNRQVFAGLRHYAVITGHHQQGVIDSSHARQHVSEKLFMPGHVDKPDNAAIRLRPVGITEIDSHAALFLFRQAVGVYPGQPFEQRCFAMVHMTCGGDNHCNNISISPASSSRQRKSSHKRPS